MGFIDYTRIKMFYYSDHNSVTHLLIWDIKNTQPLLSVPHGTTSFVFLLIWARVGQTKTKLCSKVVHGAQFYYHIFNLKIKTTIYLVVRPISYECGYLDRLLIAFAHLCSKRSTRRWARIMFYQTVTTTISNSYEQAKTSSTTLKCDYHR